METYCLERFLFIDYGGTMYKHMSKMVVFVLLLFQINVGYYFAIY